MGDSNTRDAFRRMSGPDARVRREGLPDPAKVAAAGIKTRESLDWLAQEKPEHPAPRLEPDDEDTRQDAQAQAIKTRREQSRTMRANLGQRSRKGRDDFETARSWGGDEIER